jgi:fumarate reductase flavoprotein subunit
MDIQSDPAVLTETILRITGGSARPDLARVVAKDGIRVVRWMQSVGIRFIKGPYDYQSFMLSPPTITPQGRQWEGRGGDVMLRTFESELTKLGGRVLRGHAAKRLVTNGSAVIGFAGERGDGSAFEVSAQNVVIADGGFQTNPDYTNGPITPAPEKVFQRNARTGMGEGMRMAREAGAAISDLRGFYGHVLSKDAFHTDKLWPYAWLDFVSAAGIVVRRSGRRFADEGLGGVHIANEIALLDDPSDAIVIADQRIWDERGTFNLLPPNPRLPEGGGTMYVADTLAELAAKAGVDRAVLADEVGSYNAAVAAKATASLSPVRSIHKFEAYPIAKAPFYAFPACAGITYTMGGISIDASCRVLDANDQPISGLYAVGCATGGLEGGAMKGYVGGLVKSSVTGLRAGEHILGQLED